MGGFADYKKNIEAAIKQLNSERRKNTEIMALDAFALVQNRITETGERAKGGQFEPYTEGYSKFKGKTRFVNFRDFKFTNDMWRSMTAIFEGQTKTSATYRHASNNSTDQAKVDANIDRSGNFLALSPSEIKILHETNQERLAKTLKNNGIA